MLGLYIRETLDVSCGSLADTFCMQISGGPRSFSVEMDVLTQWRVLAGDEGNLLKSHPMAGITVSPVLLVVGPGEYSSGYFNWPVSSKNSIILEKKNTNLISVTYARSDFLVAQILEMRQRRHYRLKVVQHRRTSVTGAGRLGSIRFVVLHGGVVLVAVAQRSFLGHDREVIEVDMQLVAWCLLIGRGLLTCSIIVVMMIMAFIGTRRGTSNTGILLIFIGLIRQFLAWVIRVL